MAIRSTGTVMLAFNADRLAILDIVSRTHAESKDWSSEEH
jgi:hypothetical protein